MKRFLYWIFILNVGILFFMPIDILSQNNQISTSSQEFLILDNESSLKDIEQNLNNKEKSHHKFSSLEVNMKKKKESISFDHESMRINLKYIEHK